MAILLGFSGGITIDLAVGMWGINQNDRLQWKIKKDASEGASFWCLKGDFIFLWSFLKVLSNLLIRLEVDKCFHILYHKGQERHVYKLFLFRSISK